MSFVHQQTRLTLERLPAMVFSPLRSASLWMSMISTAWLANRERPTWLKMSASMPDSANSPRCWRESPSLGVNRMTRLILLPAPCNAR